MSTEKHQHKPPTTLQPTAAKQEDTILLKRLREGWESLRSGSSSNFWFYVIIIAVIVAAYLGWDWYSRTTAETQSSMWVRVQTAQTLSELKNLADDEAAQDTLQGQLADLQRARLMSGPMGALKLGTTAGKQRAAAIKSLKQAREIFQRLAVELDEGSDLQLQALWGAANTEETLVGIPEQAGSENYLGDLDVAINHLRRIAKLAPEEPMGKQAAEKAERLEENKVEIRKFYVELNRNVESFLFDRPSANFPPGP